MIRVSLTSLGWSVILCHGLAQMWPSSGSVFSSLGYTSVIVLSVHSMHPSKWKWEESKIANWKEP